MQDLGSVPVIAADAERPHTPGHWWEVAEARATRQRADWFSWEAHQIRSILGPGDTVLDLSPASTARASSLAARAGWVFVGAADASDLRVLSSALEVVRPENLTFGPHELIRRWCPTADVVVAADWSPGTADADGALASLLAASERTVVVSGWRRPATDHAAAGLERHPIEVALACARRSGLDASIRSTLAEDGRERCVLILPGGATTRSVTPGERGPRIEADHGDA